MAHPLVGDSAGKVFVEPELKIKLRIKRPRRFRQQPFAPVSVLLTNLFHLRTTAPPWSVIVPFDFDFADVAQSAAARNFLCGTLVWLATMLRSNLNDGFGLQHRITPGFRFAENISHRLLDISIFAGFGDHSADRRMRMFRG